MLFNASRIAGVLPFFISAVKRQIQNLFRRISPHKRIILRQLLPCFVRHRRFVVLLKGKSPVLLCRTRHSCLIRTLTVCPTTLPRQNARQKSDTGKAPLLIVPFCPCRCPSESFLLCISENGFFYAGDLSADNVLARSDFPVLKTVPHTQS